MRILGTWAEWKEGARRSAYSARSGKVDLFFVPFFELEHFGVDCIEIGRELRDLELPAEAGRNGQLAQFWEILGLEVDPGTGFDRWFQIFYRILSPVFGKNFANGGCVWKMGEKWVKKVMKELS